jgi:hypothetical protein
MIERTLSTRARRRGERLQDESGFSIMEAMVATVIAVIAVIGLAHSFGLGRAFVDKFEIGRMAMSVATARREALSVLPSTAPDFAIGNHPAAPLPFNLEGAPIGTETWRVSWFDDPVTPGTTTDLRRVTVVVAWGQGIDADSVSMTRLFPN